MAGHYASTTDDQLTALHYYNLYSQQKLSEPGMVAPSSAIDGLIQCVLAAYQLGDLKTARYWARQAKALFARAWADEPALFAYAMQQRLQEVPGMWPLVSKA